jgi:Spy/CpxP family protein refolding chaperone
MKKKWIAVSSMGIAATLVLAALATAAPVESTHGGFARGPMGGGDGGQGLMPWLGVPEMMKEAGLTDPQVKALRDLYAAAHKETLRLRGDVQIASFDARYLLQQDSPDESAVMAAIEAAGQARIRLHQHLASSLMGARRLVGEEAWQNLTAQARAEIKERRQERRVRGRPARRWGTGAGGGGERAGGMLPGDQFGGEMADLDPSR